MSPFARQSNKAIFFYVTQNSEIWFSTGVQRSWVFCISSTQSREWLQLESTDVIPVGVQSLSHVQLCNPMNCSRPGSSVLHCLLDLLKLMSIELVMLSNHLILILCLQSFPASVFSNGSALRTKWSKYWSFCFSNSPSSEYSGLIFFRIDWSDLLPVQGTLKISNTTIQKHRFFGTQPALWSNSHIHTGLLEKL